MHFIKVSKIVLTALALAFILNSCSTSTSSEPDLDFTPLFTEGAGVTDLDGNSYRTILINGQEWMAENLNVSQYKNGDVIQNITDAELWIELQTGAWSIYDNDIENVETYGKLYNWFAAADARGICPEGWSVPTNEQWTQFINGLGSTQDVVNKMREVGTEHWIAPNSNATNTSGFTALPGGARLGGEFRDMEIMGVWWTRSSPNSNEAALSWRIVFEQLSRQHLLVNSNATKISGLSVRCLKN